MVLTSGIFAGITGRFALKSAATCIPGIYYEVCSTPTSFPPRRHRTHSQTPLLRPVLPIRLRHMLCASEVDVQRINRINAKRLARAKQARRLAGGRNGGREEGRGEREEEEEEEGRTRCAVGGR